MIENLEERKQARDRLKTLEDKLKAHHQQLEALHDRIPTRAAPEPVLRYWRRTLAGACRPSAASADVWTFGLWFAKWRVAFAIAAAIAVTGHQSWAVLTEWLQGRDRDPVLLLFATDAALLVLCNVFLLLYYGRINLRHKHQDFERLLDQAGKERKQIEDDMRAAEVLGRNPRVRALHLKAQVYTQSVNVVRNINYLTLCIKNEVQRHHQGLVRSQVVIFGLSMLEAIFCDQDVTDQAVMAIKGVCQKGPPGATEAVIATPADVRRVLIDSARRKNMLLSMYHLHCDVLPEGQGSLEYFVMAYLRPILVERRMPQNTSNKALSKLGDPSSSSKPRLMWG
eukprot:TRINITY_DN15961_c0_g1_i1.p1 TRINITY_DN15961_c0_g1~~TRINITY_DN15961_c0_g1_i1.p1  ORF type:complete len:386 (-),score=157.89 TRINITY_DN15961_c0_g1_i1:32-1048(-)